MKNDRANIRRCIHLVKPEELYLFIYPFSSTKWRFETPSVLTAAAPGWIKMRVTLQRSTDYFFKSFFFYEDVI